MIFDTLCKGVAKVESAMLALKGDFDVAIKAQTPARKALEASINASEARTLDCAERGLEETGKQWDRREKSAGEDLAPRGHLQATFAEPD